jgi:hypothetical protein
MALSLTLAADPALPCGTIFIVVFIAAVVIGVVVQVGRSNAAAKKTAMVRSRTDFQASDVYVSPLDQNGLSIDSTTARLLLVQGDKQHIVPASEIVSVEVMADDTSLVKTNRGSQVAGAAVGGLLLGPVGLLLGGLTGSTRSEGRVKRLVLRIVTTDFARPNHDILLYKSASNKGDVKNSILLKEPIRIAETWHSRVTVLIRDAVPKPVATVPPTGTASIADEVRKLDALRREGLLTDDEFQQQKRQLLGRGT